MCGGVAAMPSGEEITVLCNVVRLAVGKQIVPKLLTPASEL
jgi:hypothetical protein